MFLICVLVPGQPGKFQVGKVTDTSVELTWEPAYSKEPVKAYELIYKSPDLGVQVKTFFTRGLQIVTFQEYWHQLLKWWNNGDVFKDIVLKASLIFLTNRRRGILSPGRRMWWRVCAPTPNTPSLWLPFPTKASEHSPTRSINARRKQVCVRPSVLKNTLSYLTENQSMIEVLFAHEAHFT